MTEPLVERVSRNVFPTSRDAGSHRPGALSTLMPTVGAWLRSLHSLSLASIDNTDRSEAAIETMTKKH